MAYLRPGTIAPLIPDETLHKLLAQCKREYLEAKENSKSGQGDGSPQLIVDMWAMMWGSKQPTQGALYESM